MAETISVAELTRIFPEINDISDTPLREGVIAVWQRVSEQMPWSNFEEVPKNVRDQVGQSFVLHVRGVTQMAVAICEIAERLIGRSFDRDQLIAACLLHDASKPLEMEPTPGSVSQPGQIRPGIKSKLGSLIQHSVYASYLAWEAGMSLEMCNLIITHTHFSAVRGKTWEAAALFYADFADSDAGLSLVDATMFMERFVKAK